MHSPDSIVTATNYLWILLIVSKTFPGYPRTIWLAGRLLAVLAERGQTIPLCNKIGDSGSPPVEKHDLGKLTGKESWPQEL